MNWPAVFQDMIMGELGTINMHRGKVNGEVEIERKNNDPVHKYHESSEGVGKASYKR